jgi:putative transposase
MPWKEQRKMSLKIEFVEKAMRPGARMSALCREYEISRETGYKWLNRYRKEGANGLEERSRRPKHVPLASAEVMVLAILALRDKYPRRGAKKLFKFLTETYGTQTPSIATIARVLRRFGKVRQRYLYRRRDVVEQAPRRTSSTCNEIWTVDFKGWWRAGNGQRCEPLTIRDAYSRNILEIAVMPTPSMEAVRRIFLQCFRRYGVPKSIQSDNGTPFINTQSRGGLTQLSAWWVSLDIEIIRSRPGCPQDNGAHERMHRDMREDLQSNPSESRAAEQRACDRWRQEFNHARPHEALAGKTPAEVYKPSERKLRSTKAFYPPNWIVRIATKQGCISVSSQQIVIGRALAGHRVALEPLGGSTYRLWFRHMDLGTLEIPVTDKTIDEVTANFLRNKKTVTKKR